MKLKIHQVFGAVQALDAIIRDRRPMPQLGKFRLARMHAKLLPEFIAANTQRDELIVKHGARRGDGLFEVPTELFADFNAEWESFADAEVDVDVVPVRLAELGPLWDDPTNGATNGAVEASELLLLGELVTE